MSKCKSCGKENGDIPYAMQVFVKCIKCGKPLT